MEAQCFLAAHAEREDVLERSSVSEETPFLNGVQSGVSSLENVVTV
jgi:hypothetical protein